MGHFAGFCHDAGDVNDDNGDVPRKPPRNRHSYHDRAAYKQLDSTSTRHPRFRHRSMSPLSLGKIKQTLF